MTNEGPTFFDAIRNISDVPGKDLTWALITAGLVSVVYYVALNRKINLTFDKRNVVWWGLSMIGWIFAFFVFGRFQILGDGSSIAFFLIIATISFFMSHNLLQKTKNWFWIIANLTLAIFVFGAALTFALGAYSVSYSIIFGIFLGVFLSRFILSIRYLDKDVVFEDDEKKPKDFDMKDPTGI